MDDYQPVSCALSDKLEAIATLKRTVQITYRTESGDVVGATDTIVDIYADSGADYCKLADGTIIRLDRLTAIRAGEEEIL
ncbi:MAG: hypothetical protein ACFB16_06375 [Phormidesmis sp.]